VWYAVNRNRTPPRPASFFPQSSLLLPLVFVIITANSLIASQVDRGSMAYTLSMPIKRVKVVGTQALYMVTSVFCMFLVVTIVGLVVVQALHNGIWGEAHTPDVKAAAEELGIDASALASDMGRIKNTPAALHAMTSASGFPEEMIISLINQQLAVDEMALDGGMDFNVSDYLILNLGIFLLMFAIASISFLFSCIFNLTKNSMALGAGIPIAFLIIEIMSQASSDLENLKYLSLNTLFDPSAITGGGTFIPQLTALAVTGTVLYLIGIKVFKEKDLPL
jgi:ABC-type transport system involved in multi-copper enzyme maturation permease subunit